MTEYGRGNGSEPWHPDDPLYGDQRGWSDHDATAGGYPARQPGGGWDSDGAQQSYPSQQAPDPYGRYPGERGVSENGGYGGNGDYYAYEGQGGGPYRHGEPPFSSPAEGYGNGASGDYHGPAGVYSPGDVPPPPPPPQAPQRQGRSRRPEPGSGAGWDPGPDQGEEAFFSDGDADGSDYPRQERGDSRGGRRGDRNRRGRTKRRSGCACLVVVLILGGGLGTVGYFGYDYFQAYFGEAPDFAGQGRGEVQVEIPEGSTLSDMGNVLKEAGVVKSHDAFVEAAQQHEKGSSIQAGVYVLRRQMSAAAAVEMMTDPKALNALIIAEGLRNSEIYQLIDEKLGLDKGSTADVAKSRTRQLGLPRWANDDPEIRDPLEGFLFPARYDIGEKSKPEDVLRKMVAQATQQYNDYDVAGKARTLNLESPLDVVTVASLVQAEGKYKSDFEKVARVIYNRLRPGNTETNGHLDFDSTYNYAKNQSTLGLPSPSVLRQFDHPYNTYQRTGLPPGPIGNPGAEALAATLEPAPGDWYYFVSITAEETVFSDTYEEHQKNVEKYNKRAGQ